MLKKDIRNSRQHMSEIKFLRKLRKLFLLLSALVASPYVHANTREILKLKLVHHLQRWVKEDKFRHLQPIIYSRYLDEWVRYKGIVALLHKHGIISKPLTQIRLTILDVGAGLRGGIERWLNGGISFYLVDAFVDPNIVEPTGDTHIIRADASSLPFRDRSFDVCLCVDTFEHFPRSDRRKVAEELIRVAKKIVILHMPIAPLCLEHEKKFVRVYRRLYRQPDFGVEEHFKFGHPTIKEIKNIFQDCRIVLTHSVCVWYITRLLAPFPVVGWLTGFLYIILLRFFEEKPPYRSCYVIIKKHLN
jgi:SAM-dependent methyltransferase